MSRGSLYVQVSSSSISSLCGARRFHRRGCNNDGGGGSSGGCEEEERIWKRRHRKSFWGDSPIKVTHQRSHPGKGPSNAPVQVICVKEKRKVKLIHICDNCGQTSNQWVGRCSSCGEWNTYRTKEVAATSSAAQSNRHSSLRLKGSNWSASVADLDGLALPEPLVIEDKPDGQDLKSKKTRLQRLEFLDELGLECARVLGGGFLQGSVVLLGGAPGVGKSSLLAQLSGSVRSCVQQSAGFEKSTCKVLYVSGEESAPQIRDRVNRLISDNRCLSGVELLATTSVEHVIAAIHARKPELIIIDSIQTMGTDAIDSSAGSILQVRECAAALVSVAKTSPWQPAVLLVGHVTKEGNVAGPRVVEHLVDAVLYLDGDPGQGSIRTLRAVKNRFGPTDEIGVLEMTSRGLQSLRNPLALSGKSDDKTIPGAVIVPVLQGSRPMLMEVQALCAPASPATPPRRVGVGIDMGRLLLLIAVLVKRGRLRKLRQLGRHDVFCNVTGGMKLGETGADAALAVAIVSSLLDRPTKAGFCIVGEVGLGGELRAVSRLNVRLAEASAYGLDTVVIPKANLTSTSSQSHEDGERSQIAGPNSQDLKLTILPCATITDAIDVILEEKAVQEDCFDEHDDTREFG